MVTNPSTQSPIDGPYGEVVDPRDLVFTSSERARMVRELREVPQVGRLLDALKAADRPA